MRNGETYWAALYGARYGGNSIIGGIVGVLGVAILVPFIPAFIIQIILDLFLDLWEDMLLINIFAVLIMTAAILYLELHEAKQENPVYYRGRKAKGKKNKINVKMILTFYLITFLVGYPISVVSIELVPFQELAEHFYDKQMAEDGFFKSLGYNYLFLLFYYIEHLIYLIIIPVAQLFLVNMVKKLVKKSPATLEETP